MNWYYALGGQQQGPVDDARLDALLAAGTINAETLVWREGMQNWQAIRLARPTAAAPPVPPAIAPPEVALPPAAASGAVPPAGDEVQCAECGRRFTRDNVIQYGSTAVCAACKPIFLQRLREGAGPSAFTGIVSEEQLLARPYRIEIGDCLSRAWKLFSENAGIVLGVSLLAGAVFLVGGLAAGLLGAALEALAPTAGQFIAPFLNQVLMAVITGPIAGGYFWFLLRLARGEQAGVNEAFSGFSKRFGPLLMCSLVQGLIQLACIGPALIVMTVFGLQMASQGGGPPNISPGLVAAMAGSGLLAFVGMTYFSTVWTHSYFLIMDKNYNFWPAMRLSWRVVHKRWWMTWVLLLVGTIIASSGVLACCIGALVTLPLYLAMRAWFYEDNFRDLARAGQGT